MIGWFTLSQEYALPLNYIIEPPGGLLWNAKVDYNIVTTLVITVFHIFSVKDLFSHINVYTVISLLVFLRS